MIKVNIVELEKILAEKYYSEDEFRKLIEEKNFSENFFEYPVKRKLTEEEIDYEYFDDFIVNILESLSNEDKVQEHHHEHGCCGAHTKPHTCECCDTEKDRLEKSMASVYRIGLYLLREGIHYEDMTQDGMLALMRVDTLYSDDKEFEKYKLAFIAKAMIEHIQDYSNYRKTAFKQYVESEKSKPKKIKISINPENKEKMEEMKKLEMENKIRHNEDIKRLEEMSESMFDYKNLKYRLSLREIEALELYFGLSGKNIVNFDDLKLLLNISSDEVDKLLKEAIFKLSVTEERVEI